MELRNDREKQIYLAGYLRAQAEQLAQDIGVDYTDARILIIEGFRQRLKGGESDHTVSNN